MIRITKQQQEAILNKWRIDDQGLSYKRFRKNVYPTFGCDDAVTLYWCNMWLCIEKNGYTHT